MEMLTRDPATKPWAERRDPMRLLDVRKMNEGKHSIRGDKHHADRGQTAVRNSQYMIEWVAPTLKLCSRTDYEVDPYGN